MSGTIVAMRNMECKDIRTYPLKGHHINEGFELVFGPIPITRGEMESSLIVKEDNKGAFNMDMATLPDALDLIVITSLWVLFAAVALFIMKRLR
jgi:hypothetical protein